MVAEEGSLSSMRRLEEHAARLFITENADHETNVDCISIGLKEKQIRTLSSHQQVSEFLDNVGKNKRTPLCSIYLLKHKSSWSPLLITAADFSRLLKINGVFPAYGDYISSFGRRSQDNDSRFGGYERSFDYNTGKLEICYNIRYPAKHGRQGCLTPWSFRQVGIYHSFSVKTGKSVWILVQCPLPIQLLMKSAQEANIGEEVEDTWQPLMLHQLIQNEVLSQWRDYGNYLDETLQEINTKSQAFGAQRIMKHDYNVTFDDAQDIQLLGKEMLLSKHAIDSASKIVAGLQLHQGHFLKEIGELSSSYDRDYDPVVVALESLSSRLDAESRGFSTLIELSEDIENQLHKILEYRHDEALQDNTLSLAQISKSSRTESMEMQKLAQETYKDSKSMRVLSSVALVYLPASLIISIFSSDLIIDTNSTSDPAKSHYAISGEFWWFPVLTLPLLFLTVGCALVWDKLQKRRDMAKFRFDPATDG